MITLLIPDVCPSLNKYLRMHWALRTKVIALWRRWVWVACVQSGVATRQPLPFSYVTIERRGKKLLDPDSLFGSQKVLIDCLRAHGLILDDSPKHIALIVTQTIGAPQTLIRISGSP